MQGYVHKDMARAGVAEGNNPGSFSAHELAGGEVMDRRVTVRYYRVEPTDRAVPAFANVLAEIGNIAALQDRFRNANLEDADQINVRLERLDEDGDFLIGEFTRLQAENIPPEVLKDGLKPVVLSDGIGLGHVAAFRYHKPTRVLALQANPQL